MQKCRRDSFEVQYLGVGGGEGGGGVCLDVQARDFAIGPSAGVVYGFVGSLVAGKRASRDSLRASGVGT